MLVRGQDVVEEVELDGTAQPEGAVKELLVREARQRLLDHRVLLADKVVAVEAYAHECVHGGTGAPTVLAEAHPALVGARHAQDRAVQRRARLQERQQARSEGARAGQQTGRVHGRGRARDKHSGAGDAVRPGQTGLGMQRGVY